MLSLPRHLFSVFEIISITLFGILIVLLGAFTLSHHAALQEQDLAPQGELAVTKPFEKNEVLAESTSVLFPAVVQPRVLAATAVVGTSSTPTPAPKYLPVVVPAGKHEAMTLKNGASFYVRDAVGNIDVAFTPSSLTVNNTLNIAGAVKLADDALPTNGILYAGDHSKLQTTRAESAGQLLLANDSKTPSFVTISGDATVSSTGGLTITCTDCLNATEIEDIYLLNSGDAGTGAFDFGGATSFEVVNGASPTVDATGELAIDTTADDLIYFGASTKRNISYKQTRSFTIESPADADNFLLFKAPYAMTITSINCVVDPADSSESVVIDIQERDSNGDSPASVDTTITCANTNTADDGTLSNAAIDANDWVGIDIGTVTGTVTQVSVTIGFTKDAE